MNMVNNNALLLVLIVGSILMCIPISIQMRWYGVRIWKSIIVSIVLVYTGLFGSRLWYFVENGNFVGRSFYGAIFLAPIVYLPLAIILNISYKHILDFCAPAGCLTLSLVKIQCLLDGCCEGIALFIDENHNYVKFPSQIVEMFTFLIIGGYLMFLSSKERNRGKIFLWFLILYGSSRFVLNFFRDNTSPYMLGLSAGSFWSLLAFIIGFILLKLENLRQQTEK